MIDENLILRVSGITGVHNEARQMTNAINPEWIAVEIPRGCLKLDQRCSFMLIAVENNLLNGLVVVVVFDKRTEQLIHHTALHTVGITRLSAVLEVLDTPLDEVAVAFPFQFCGAGIEEFDCAISMVNHLLSLWGDRPDLHLRTLFGPVCCSRDPEELLASLGNQRLGHHHVANIESTLFPFGFVLVDQELAQCLGNISVQGLDRVSARFKIS